MKAKRGLVIKKDGGNYLRMTYDIRQEHVESLRMARRLYGIVAEGIVNEALAEFLPTLDQRLRALMEPIRRVTPLRIE